MPQTVSNPEPGMTYLRAHSLVVLTLLQLCRAEISDTLSESWYSANVIQDGFQPKPLSEMFSTPPAFSSTNPIIVLQSTAASNEMQISPITSITASSPDDYSKLTLIPSAVSTPSPSSIQTSVPQTLSALNLQTQDLSRQTDFLSSPEITQQTLPPSTLLLRPESQQTTIFAPQPTTGPTTISIPEQQRTIYQNPTEFDLGPVPQIIQNQPMSDLISKQLPQSLSDKSNYIVIYQQAPQYVQGESLTSSQVTTPQSIISSTLQPTISTTVQPTFSTTLSSSSQFTSTNSQPPIISSLRPNTASTPGSTVFIQPSPTVSPPSTRTAPPTFSTSFRPINVDSMRSPGPKCNITDSSPTVSSGNLRFPLKIRVVAPRGSITNVMINPATTTTRKPTTTRTRKPKRNTYESCTDGCKGNRKPICGIPLSSTVIDTNTLKGFPSVCHMACHNSYRRNAYEQLLEGRCSLLRTRIRTIDSKTKLKRDELNKAHYVLDNNGPHTVVEFSGALQK